MLLELAIATAQPAAEVQHLPGYVAHYVPSATITLDPEQVCKDGFVQPQKLAVQFMVQLKMYDQLAAYSGTQALKQFDGSTCRTDKQIRDAKVAGEKADEAARKQGYCTGTIVMQRLLLNVYPGFAPRSDGPAALELARVRALAPDMEMLDERQEKALLDYQKAFLDSKALVLCGRAPPEAPKDAPKRAQSEEYPTLVRSSAGAKTANVFHYGATAAKALQFRRYPSNLAYRSKPDSDVEADPTYLAGRDLYAADSGVSFDISRSVDRDADKDKRSRTVAGAIGLPLCGLITHIKEDPRDWRAMVNGLGDDCEFGKPRQENMPKRYSANLIPYYSRDWSYEKTTAVGAEGEEPKADPNLREGGVVAFLRTDDLPYGVGCARLFNNCQHYFVGRYFQLKNKNDGSLLEGVSLRYIPVFKTKRSGLDAQSLDLCLNSICGDPDRILRLGVLADARLNFGDYLKQGDPAVGHPERRDDFTRIGGRAGFLGTLNLVPDLPVNGWIGYTYLAPLRGYDRELGQWQTELSVALGSATFSVSWIRGEREDTAAEEDTFSVSLGFKN